MRCFRHVQLGGVPQVEPEELEEVARKREVWAFCFLHSVLLYKCVQHGYVTVQPHACVCVCELHLTKYINRDNTCNDV